MMQLIGISIFTFLLAYLLYLAIVAKGLKAEQLLRLGRWAAMAVVSLPVSALITRVASPSALVPMVSLPLPVPVDLSLLLDSPGLIMCSVVATIGAIVVLFSARYMVTEPRAGIFMRWLLLTLAASTTMTVAASMIIFAALWVATSVCLHQLLTFYPDRIEAQACARTKFVISRLGDLGVLAGVTICALVLGDFNFTALTRVAGTPDWPVQLAAVCFALGALTKSAQLPFHFWLPRSLETPTPVSALMHAGIINGGGFLLLRTSPVVSSSPWAIALLIVIGAATAVYGMSCMVTQTSIKKRLAYSTIGQMGFMIAEIGLGLYAAALLHIVGHAFYKACAFLRSGSAMEQEREQRFFPSRSIPSRWQVMGAVVLIVLASVAAWWMLPLPYVPIAIIASSALVYLLQSTWLSHSVQVGWHALWLIGTVVVCYGAGTWLITSMATWETVPATYQNIVVVIATAMAAALFMISGMLQVAARTLTQTRWGQQLIIHLHRGLYLETWGRRFDSQWRVRAES